MYHKAEHPFCHTYTVEGFKLTFLSQINEDSLLAIAVRHNTFLVFLKHSSDWIFTKIMAVIYMCSRNFTITHLKHLTAKYTIESYYNE